MPHRAALAADDAIDALVELSRDVATAADSEAVLRLLVDAARRHLAPEVAAVYRTAEDGGSALAHVHGRPREALADEEPGYGVGLPVVLTLPLVSGGDLFGTLVVAWGAHPGPYTDRLASGLTDIAATALDRAHRTRELVDTIRALEESRHELARTESLRHLGQLAAVVAHEVKNPLASIGGVLQVLRSRAAAGTPDHEILGKVLGRLGELDHLVNELLQLSRPREPVREPVALDAFAREVVELFRQDPAARAVEVALSVERATVRLDRGMIQRVLLNLLLNAAQAMDGTGRIDVATRADGRAAEVTVTDRGPGIPPELRERVFDPFYTTKVRGTGLGLPVARQAVAAHGGTLSVVEGPDGGARFVLRFPLG